MFNIFSSKKIIIKAPLAGEIVKINDVPDEAFARKMIGDGVAIKPTSSCLASPVNGKIVQKFSTNHALGIETKEGLEILLHLGIDTVHLKGEGFEALVDEGQQVIEGDSLIKVDWALISEKIPSTITPIVITNIEIVESIEVLAEGKIKTGEDLLAVKIKK